MDFGHSQFYWKTSQLKASSDFCIKIDYTNYSLASVKLFLDCLHLIPVEPTSVAILIECVDFCQFQGKTTFDSFEADFVERIMTSVMKMALPLGTELLISAYLAKVANFGDRYQREVAKKLTKEAVSALFYEFDMNDALNKRLIEMCVQKKVFADNSQQSVVFTLMMYGKDLQDNPAGNSESRTSSTEDDFRPDPSAVRY